LGRNLSQPATTKLTIALPTPALTIADPTLAVAIATPTIAIADPTISEPTTTFPVAVTSTIEHGVCPVRVHADH
jgi:hypothetical protein